MRRSSLLFLAVLVVLPSQTTAGARRASRQRRAALARRARGELGGGFPLGA